VDTKECGGPTCLRPQMPLMPHAEAREWLCGFMGRLSDGAIGGAVRRPALELHHGDESDVGARVRWEGLVKSRLALVMRILEGLRRRPLGSNDRGLCATRLIAGIWVRCKHS